MTQKSDARAIRRVLSERAKKLDVGSRQWWLNYAFHFTDVRNAAGVLREGHLYCRAQATAKGLMVVENADREVIKRRPELTDQYARLYFRPRTPTQYRNEGIRPIAKRESHNAHCPVPVFFLFDLQSVLVREGSLFTDVAANWDEAYPRGSAKALRRMPWADIYSSGGMGIRIHELTGARRAEILVKDSVDLQDLRLILCRSGPERDMLLHLLPEQMRRQWSKKIRLAGRLEVFETHWTYLKSITWVGDELVFSFSPRPANFQTNIRVTDQVDDVCYEWEGPWLCGPRSNVLRIKLRSDLMVVEPRIELDDALAYHAVVLNEELFNATF